MPGAAWLANAVISATAISAPVFGVCRADIAVLPAKALPAPANPDPSQPGPMAKARNLRDDTGVTSPFPGRAQVGGMKRLGLPSSGAV
ncbi:hypothetical protein D3C71_1109300 [compost metagenome]